MQSFFWTLGGATYAVHAAVGPDVTQANVRAAKEALASFSSAADPS